MLKILSLYKIKPRFEPKEVCSKARFFSLLFFPVYLRMCRRVGEASWNPGDTCLPAEKVCLQGDAPGLRVIAGFATGMFELSHSVSSNFLLLPSQLLVRRFVKVTSSS